MAKGVGDQAANGIELFVGELGAKAVIEITDLGDRFHKARAILLEADGGVFFMIVFVLNLADDLFENIFNCHQACDFAVLVDHHSHVRAIVAEFFQQLIQPLALRHPTGRANHFLDIKSIKVGLENVRQQIFGQQNTHHLAGLITEDGKTGVGGFDHPG